LRSTPSRSQANLQKGRRAEIAAKETITNVHLIPKLDQVTFTPQLLLKDMDLGLGAARTHAVMMPCAAAARESIGAMAGRGHDGVDFAVLLMKIARNNGFEPKPDGVTVSDGLQ
jgi:3-hydroxyisobutyrate dehydrogenase-like beta-hydroxyacid dehydrogenase